MIAISHPQSERGHDLYPTPACATLAMLQVESLPPRIWEPCAGRGGIVRVLRDAGHAVIASDIIRYDFPLHFTGDLLEQTKAPDGCTAIVSNFPYDRKHLTRLVSHALDLCPRLILLSRLTFLESVDRTEILERRGLARIHVFRDRLQGTHREGWAGKKAKGATAYAWMSWERGYRGPIVVDRITAKPDKRGRR